MMLFRGPWSLQKSLAILSLLTFLGQMVRDQVVLHSLVSWKGGKILVWDVTCPDTLVSSYVSLAVCEPEAVVAEEEYIKLLKCRVLPSSYSLISILVDYETLGLLGMWYVTFLQMFLGTMRRSLMTTVYCNIYCNAFRLLHCEEMLYLCWKL